MRDHHVGEHSIGIRELSGVTGILTTAHKERDGSNTYNDGL